MSSSIEEPTYQSDILDLAREAYQVEDSRSSAINNFKQAWLKSFGERTATRADFENQRSIWNFSVFIHGIQDEAKKQRLIHLWRIKGTKGRSNARKENAELAKELAVFDKTFDNIANEMFGMPVRAFKRRRDPMDDEQQLYDTGMDEIRFGISRLKELFPMAKNILECCAGNRVMVAELEREGYNVIALDKFPTASSVQYCDIYSAELYPDIDVVFKNPPWKNKAKFFDVMYEYLKIGKGFCIMLPTDSISQKDVAKSVERMTDLQIINMLWTPTFKKNGKDSKPVGKCSWFIGGSTLVPANKIAVRSYNFLPEDIV